MKLPKPKHRAMLLHAIARDIETATAIAHAAARAAAQHAETGRPDEALQQAVSDKLEPVSGFWNRPALAGAKLPPLGKCGGSVLFEILSAVEVAFLVEMIVD